MEMHITTPFLFNRISDLKNVAFKLECELRHAIFRELKSNVLMKGILVEGTLPSDLVLSDGWECEESPTRHCIYNNHIDPAHNMCVYCRKPEERK